MERFLIVCLYYIIPLWKLEYVPFYGGAKGQYLELKKDKNGIPVSQRIVDGLENSIGTKFDNTKKVTEDTDDEDENSRTGPRLAAALRQVRTYSTDASKTLDVAVRRGSITAQDRVKLSLQITSLSTAMQAASNLINASGEELEFLFRRRPTSAKYDDDVGEEGLGVDSSEDSGISGFPGLPGGILGGAIIAEAKPVGLAVIGENGLAAARPIGTAVASSGVAIARPVGTAIAGIDPSKLGINFQINKS